jgi:hypothetical protein
MPVHKLTRSLIPFPLHRPLGTSAMDVVRHCAHARGLHSLLHREIRVPAHRPKINALLS